MANERFIRTADASVLVRLKELISAYRATDITFYPSEELRVILLEARLMLLVGNYDVAWQILRPLADRPYSIEGDFETMAHLFRPWTRKHAFKWIFRKALGGLR